MATDFDIFVEQQEEEERIRENLDATDFDANDLDATNHDEPRLARVVTDTHSAKIVVEFQATQKYNHNGSILLEVRAIEFRPENRRLSLERQTLRLSNLHLAVKAPDVVQGGVIASEPWHALSMQSRRKSVSSHNPFPLESRINVTGTVSSTGHVAIAASFCEERRAGRYAENGAAHVIRPLNEPRGPLQQRAHPRDARHTSEVVFNEVAAALTPLAPEPDLSESAFYVLLTNVPIGQRLDVRLVQKPPRHRLSTASHDEVNSETLVDLMPSLSVMALDRAKQNSLSLWALTRASTLGRDVIRKILPFVVSETDETNPGTVADLEVTYTPVTKKYTRIPLAQVQLQQVVEPVAKKTRRRRSTASTSRKISQKLKRRL